MKNKFYIVIAYRWGARENHSYFVGLFDKKHAALKCAEKENDHRGGKYECEVIETEISKKWRDAKRKYIREVGHISEYSGHPIKPIREVVED